MDPDDVLRAAAARAKELLEATSQAEAAPADEVVSALLDYLVEPTLPYTPTPNPDAALHQAISKQMHALVLLYNYYHRRQFPQREFLDFESLCKLAMKAKPVLLAFMNYMKSGTGDGLYNNLSVTEKEIMDACNISMGLNTLIDTPGMEGWPISDVAVFLTDHEEKKCFIQLDTITRGVWSLIQKSYSGNALQGASGKKQKRGGKSSAAVLKHDEAHLRQFAISAVEETTGICSNELTILESHVTYSLSKEKSTAKLFIIKCNSVHDSVIDVPIYEVIDSMQGPLVKYCFTYIKTDRVDYFHLLPYAEMIVNWFSRERLANISVDIDKHNFSKNLPGKNDDLIISTHISEESSGNRQGADPRQERNSTLEVLDHGVTKLSTEVKEDMLCPDRDACNNVIDIDDTQTSLNVFSKDLTILASEKVHVGPCSLSSAGEGVQKSIKRNHIENVEILKPEDIIDGEQTSEKTMILKDLATIKFPTDINPDKPLHSSDRRSLEDAILMVFTDVETSSVIRRVQACQKWEEIEDIRAEILNRRNDLLSQSRKRQRGCVGGVESDVGFDRHDLDIGLKCARVHAKEEENQNALIPWSLPDSIVSVGPIYFPKKYIDLYNRIVTKFGEVIVQESKEVTMFSDMVSTAIKGLFEVIDSMLQSPPDAIDRTVLERWDMKLQFCEFAGLKVGWLRDHFKKMRKLQAVRELEGHTAVLEECLDAKRKRAADLSKELELVRAEEKELMKKKILVDADLEAARARQEAIGMLLD